MRTTSTRLSLLFRAHRNGWKKSQKNEESVIYKDFAHSPSKVGATTAAVKEQYPDRKLVACLELHTYSSLNASFLEEYAHTLDAADEAIVFYTPEALEIKRLEALSKDQIEASFKRNDLQIFTRTTELKSFLEELDFENTVLLLMSSGNYGGLSIESLKALVQ